MKPIISYVIPCYNCETTITETVHSIKDTHEAFRREKELPSQWDQIEVILVDDGSTDATPYILEALASEHPNIKVITQENCGKGIARNRGNELAGADIIAALDSDDWHITDRTAYILKAFNKDVKADVFYSSFLAKHLYEGKNFGHEEPMFAKQININNLRHYGEFGIGHSTVAYRREVILRYPYATDRNKDDWWMLWTLYVNGCKFIYSPKFTVIYRINSKSRKIEVDEEKIAKIRKKKQKIMEPYFNKRNAA